MQGESPSTRDQTTQSTAPVTTILDEIVAAKRAEVRRVKAELPEAILRRRLADAPPVRDFLAPLRRPGRIRLIAEVKKASPSAGVIRPDFHPARIAETYQRHGADCISVLTDRPYFQGSLDDLGQVRAAVDLPVLRKDFVIDGYQVVEARAAGADAVLLIVAALDADDLKRLYQEAREFQLDVLVEAHDLPELERALDLDADLVGINNRNLKTFETTLETTERLAPMIPADRMIVGESGLFTPADLARLERVGVNTFLIGESLMRQDDVTAATRAILTKPEAVRASA